MVATVMRRSKTVTILLCSSLAIFGVGHMTGCDDNTGYYDQDGNWVATTQPDDQFDGWEPTPVYIDGVMGVYEPGTTVFVPSTSPRFSSVCTSIKSSYISSVRAGTVSSTSIHGGFGAMGGKAGIAT